MTETRPLHGPYSSLRITRDDLAPAWLSRWEEHRERMLATRGPAACWPRPGEGDGRVQLASGRFALYVRCVVAEGLPARHSCGRADCCNSSYLMPGTMAGVGVRRRPPE